MWGEREGGITWTLPSSQLARLTPLELQGGERRVSPLLDRACSFQVPPFQINLEYFTLRSVGIRREKKKTGLRLTESAFSVMEELVSVSCGEWQTRVGRCLFPGASEDSGLRWEKARPQARCLFHLQKR